MKQSTPTAEALSTLTMATLMQACGGSDDARAQTATAVDPIEGFWQSSVALQDCSTGAPLGGFRGVTVFAAGGMRFCPTDFCPTDRGGLAHNWSDRDPAGVQ